MPCAFAHTVVGVSEYGLNGLRLQKWGREKRGRKRKQDQPHLVDQQCGKAFSKI